MVKLSEQEQKILARVKDTVWFAQYEKHNPKGKTISLISKVKKGIKKGYYGNYYSESRNPDEDKRGHKAPKIKTVKTGKPINMFTPVKKPAIKKNERERKYTPQTKVRVERARQKYPNATNYELRHGVNSKASKAYRQRNRIPEVY